LKVNKTSKTAAFLLLTLIAFSFSSFTPSSKAQNGVVLVRMEPATLTVDEGKLFNITIYIENIPEDPGVVGVEFKVYWDPSVLKAASMEEVMYHTVTPEPEWDNIWKLKHEVADDHVWYAYTWMDMPRAVEGGYAPINITTAEYPPEGKLAAAIITLEVVKAPTMAEGFVESALNITVSKPGYLSPPLGPGGAIPHTVEHGYYKLSWSPPVVKPYFSVEPPTYEATELGEVFNISIKVNDLDAGWEAVGFEFKLGFNSSILEVLDVYEGPWLPPFGAEPNQGTLFMSVISADYVLVGDVVLPDENGTWHPPFPHGSGVLAIITFNATYQGLFPEVASCDLDLYDIKVGNWLAEPIATDPEVDGSYSIRPKVLGRMIDIYTQYPDPYGGQGIGKPSDMFWPQKEVILYAEVTYNEWPEQNKDVAFQIIDPHGETWGIEYARTNASGIAVTSFRLPWPCDNPEYWFGEWTIIGTVDIACEIVNDTLTFHYDYLVHIVKVTTDKTEYAHCEYMDITIEYQSKAMQTYDVVIAVTVKDETRVPFGFEYVETTIGGAEYCTYKDYTEGVSIHVVKWARAGTATIEVGALNDFPFNGGTVISGPFEPVTVSILAQ